MTSDRTGRIHIKVWSWTGIVDENEGLRGKRNKKNFIE